MLPAARARDALDVLAKDWTPGRYLACAATMGLDPTAVAAESPDTIAPFPLAVVAAAEPEPSAKSVRPETLSTAERPPRPRSGPSPRRRREGPARTPHGGRGGGRRDGRGRNPPGAARRGEHAPAAAAAKDAAASGGGAAKGGRRASAGPSLAEQLETSASARRSDAYLHAARAKNPLASVPAVDFTVDDGGFAPYVHGAKFEEAVLASARLDARLRGARLDRAEFEIALLLVAQFAFGPSPAESAARAEQLRVKAIDALKAFAIPPRGGAAGAVAAQRRRAGGRRRQRRRGRRWPVQRARGAQRGEEVAQRANSRRPVVGHEAPPDA